MSERSNDQQYTFATKVTEFAGNEASSLKGLRIELRKETQRIPGTKDLLTCCRADGVHPLNETKSTTVATKAVSQVAADDESTQILKALNGVRLHRESREGRSYQCCCESGSTLW